MERLYDKDNIKPILWFIYSDTSKLCSSTSCNTVPKLPFINTKNDSQRTQDGSNFNVLELEVYFWFNVKYSEVKLSFSPFIVSVSSVIPTSLKRLSFYFYDSDPIFRFQSRESSYKDLTSGCQINIYWNHYVIFTLVNGRFVRILTLRFHR